MGDAVMDVKGSKKLYDNICRLVNPTVGMSSSMQRAMRFISMQRSGQTFDIPRKIIEFNVEHPVVKKLADIYQANPKDGRVRPIIRQLFENCLLAEGDLPQPALMVPRMNRIIEILITGNVPDESDEVLRLEEEAAAKKQEMEKEEFNSADAGEDSDSEPNDDEDKEN